MKVRVLILLLTTALPGFGAMALSAFYLVADWAALEQRHQKYATLAVAGAPVQELSIGKWAELRHRLNCFAVKSRWFAGGCDSCNRHPQAVRSASPSSVILLFIS
ncbi:hypothetical protein [Myxacorys almedinensis]|uniref:hypothetical protein n=1 Tax=Myxacorys almedinensis TaxID=2651157 RepID=UPI00192F0F2B|nr:hypothetical protein [Myxacorys almedinensis]